MLENVLIFRTSKFEQVISFVCCLLRTDVVMDTTRHRLERNNLTSRLISYWLISEIIIIISEIHNIHCQKILH